MLNSNTTYQSEEDKCSKSGAREEIRAKLGRDSNQNQWSGVDGRHTRPVLHMPKLNHDDEAKWQRQMGTGLLRLHVPSGSKSMEDWEPHTRSHERKTTEIQKFND